MSDLTTSILIQAADEASPQFVRVSRSVSALGDELAKLQDTDTFQTLGGYVSSYVDIMQIATAVTGGFAGLMGKEAVDAAISWQSAVADLNKVLTEAEQVDFQKQIPAIDALAQKYGVVSTEVVAAVGNFKAAGYEFSESAQLQVDAMNLMIAGGISAGESSEYLVRVLKGFSAPVSDAAKAVDIFNALENTTAASTKDLAQAVADLSPIAKAMGFNIAETAALSAPIIEIFGSAGDASEGLKTTLQKLQDSAAPVQKALSELGVAQHDASGALREGRDIYFDVAKAFENLDATQQLYYSGQLAGIDQAARAQVAFSSLAKVQENVQAALTATTDVTKSATAEVAIRLQTTEQAIATTGAALNQLARDAGTQLLPAVNSVTSGLSILATGLKESINANQFKPLFDFFNKTAEEFNGLMTRIATMLPEALALVDFSGLVNSFESLKSALNIENFFANVTSSASGLAAGIQFVVDSFAGFINASAGAVSGFTPFLNAMTTAVGVFNNFFPVVQTTMGYLNGFFAGFSALNVGGIIGTVAELGALYVILNKVMPLFPQIAAYISPLIGIFNSFGLAGRAIVSLISPMSGLFLSAAANASILTTAFIGLQSAFGLPAAAMAGFSVGTVLNEWLGLSDAISHVAGSITGLNQEFNNAATGTGDMTGAVQKLIELTGDASITTENYAEKARAYYASLNESSEKLTNNTKSNADAVAELSAQNIDPLAQSFADAQAALGLMPEALNGLLPTTYQVEEAFKKLGITSQSELQKTADTAASAFQTLEQGNVPVDKLREGFIAYAQAATDANGKVIPEFIKTKAEALGMADALDSVKSTSEGLEKSFETLGVTSQTELQKTADAAQKAFEAIAASDAPVDRIRESFIAYAQAATDANGGVISGFLKTEAATRGFSDALAEVKEKPSELEKAFQTLGVTSQSELNKTADSARIAFETLKEANVPLAQLQEGFIAYAQAATDANGGVISDLIKSKAEALGMSDALLDIKTVAQGVEGSFAAMGLKTRDQLAQSAEVAKKYFLDIANSGQATAQVTEEAFKKYAQAAIEANGNIVSGQLEAEAASYGMVAALDAVAEKAIETKEAVKSANAEVQESGESVKSGAAGVYGYFKSLIDGVAEFSQKAADGLATAFSMPAAASQTLESRVQGIKQQLDELNKSAIWSAGMSGHAWTQMEVMVSSAGLAAAQSKLHLENLTEQYSKLDNAAGKNILTIEEAKSTFSSLNEADLSPLLNEINRITESTQRAKAAIEQTTQSLRDQIDELKGNTEAIREREVAAERAKAKEQAQAAGVSDAEAQSLITQREGLRKQKEQEAAREKNQTKTQREQANSEREEDTRNRTQTTTSNNQTINMTINDVNARRVGSELRSQMRRMQ